MIIIVIDSHDRIFFRFRFILPDSICDSSFICDLLMAHWRVTSCVLSLFLVIYFIILLIFFMRLLTTVGGGNLVLVCCLEVSLLIYFKYIYGFLHNGLGVRESPSQFKKRVFQLWTMKGPHHEKKLTRPAGPLLISKLTAMTVSIANERRHKYLQQQ